MSCFCPALSRLTCDGEAVYLLTPKKRILATLLMHCKSPVGMSHGN